MNKKFDIPFLVKVLVYSKYFPIIVIRVKNWCIFVLNYIGIRNDINFVYALRDGTKIKVDDNINIATMAVVFIKKDYGEVEKNSVIIDIGANIGVYSVFAARKENNIVYAFEPMTNNFKLLVENIKLNKLEGKILPFNLAVGAKKEKRTLYLGGSPFHSLYPAENSPFNTRYDNKLTAKQNYIEIECISLKDIFQENKIGYCNMLKLDCEGAEFEILYSLPEEYFKKIEKIRVEYHDHKVDNNCTGKKLAEFLINKGFKIEKLKEVSPYNGDMWFFNPGYRKAY
ncbi:MAG: FkbM family methyltransferase [Candidatus Staskawiczbacteria bacterium]|nr:FkbM family methyltransferase [Candidatus Staskawiczbacteria bacterium]